ncbi:MAG: MFS transporter [Amnibacterium sp.]
MTAIPTTAPAGRRAWRLSLAGTLVSSLGGGLTLPFLLVYLHSIRQVPLPVAGVVVAVSAVVGMVATTGGGPLGDRIGLGRTVVVGLVAQATGTALLAVGGGLAEATVAVSVIAAGNGIAWPALNGLIAGQLPLAEQPRAYALRFGVLNAGLGIGGLASGWIVSLQNPASFQLIYGIDASTTALFALLVVVGMRRTPGFRADPAHPHHDGDGPRQPRGYRAVLADRAFVGYLSCALALGVFGYAQLNGPWAAFATLVGHATPRVVGIGFAVNTAAIVVSQLAVVRLTRTWRRTRQLALTAALWALAWAATGLATVPALRGLPAALVLVLALGVFGLGETFLCPVSGAMPNVLAPPHLRARYNALAATTWPLGGLIGPPVAGLLLGGPAPLGWVVLITAGTAATAVGGLVLGRFLPARADEAPAA